MHIKATLASCLRSAALVLASALLTSHAEAMSLREFQILEKTDTRGENHAYYYLVGAMEGALEAHQQDVRNGARPAICLKGSSLEPFMARNLFDAERLRNAGLYEADMPVQLVLTNALFHFYAC